MLKSACLPTVSLVLLAACSEPHVETIENARPDTTVKVASIPVESTPVTPLFRDLAAIDYRHEPGREGNRELPETMGGGLGFIDFDGDGNLDLYLAQSGPIPKALDTSGYAEREAAANQMWRGDGAGGFQVAPGLAADRGYGQGVHAADLDGDGRPDLLALNWGRNGVWRNVDGTGFDDVTGAWGMGADRAWCTSAGVLDFDADGDLDIYIANYVDAPPGAHLDPKLNSNAPGPNKGYPHPDRYAAQADVLWRNDLATAQTFTDVSGEMGVANGDPQKGLGVIPTDVELDGWVDLYVANDSTPNMLLHNMQGQHFEEHGRKLGLAFNESGKTEAGMGVDTADVDRDGDLDLFVTNLDMETNSLYLNRFEPSRSRAGFRDQTLRMGLAAPSRGFVGFSILFDDVDLDGDPDAVVVNGHVVDNIEEISDSRTYAQPNQIYLNEVASGQARFNEAPANLLPPGFLKRTVSRASSLGDLDGDLDLDLAVGNNNDAPMLFAATPPSKAPRLALRLKGPGQNTEGLGAAVWLHFAPSKGSTTQPDWLGRMERSKGYGASSQALLVTGLPGELASIEIMWPGGRREIFEDLPKSGGAVTLEFGSGE